MLELMYDVPSLPNVKEVIINEEVITSRETPIIMYEKEEKEAS